MKTYKVAILIIVAAVLQIGVSAQQNEFKREFKSFVYKSIDTTNLRLNVYYPDKGKVKPNSPAIVFFFGGGWSSGSIIQFVPHSEHLASRGMVAIVVDYRTRNSAGTSPYISVSDAKSAMRYVRSHASELGIDPNRIAASGGSAGGHLAAATAYVKSFDDQNDDTSVSPVPNALVLFNPVIDNSEQGYGYERVQDRYKEFSPMHNIAKGAPVTLFMIGDKDHLIPVETARQYQKLTQQAGARCDLKIYEGSKHGFFNYKNTEAYTQTLWEMDNFLVSLGYIESIKK